MNDTRIAFVGGGNMGRALIAAVLHGGVPAGNLAVADPHEPTRDALARDFGVRAYGDNATAIDGATVVVLAVKPQEMASVVGSLREPLQRGRPLLLSVAAGIRCADLLGWCGGGLDVVRAMPNRPALVGAGATALYAPAAVASTRRELATRIIRPSGTVVWLEHEAQMDAVTALSGSGPAYFFLLAEAMADAAAALGLEPATARRLAVATLHGAGAMAGHGTADGPSAADESAADWSMPRMRAEVTSKGGTTEAALRSLEAAGFRAAVAAAMRAAAERSAALAAQPGCGTGRR
jgi:pyrroline-5-carboxylate reductase